METSFDHNTNNTSAGNNPFLMNPTSDSVPYQKAGLLLDLGGAGDAGLVYKHNGTSPSSTDLYFLDRPANGKKSTGVGNYEDDDFGPETDVDAVDDVLPSPAAAKPATLNNNPFGDDEKRALEADLELQRQQLSDFDPVREPREETPTPPADEVPGVTTLVPESDNVAESGEDSEDEWNYFRVEPTAEGKEQAAQQICQKPAKPQLEDESNMESQLNPDAAEFVPSPTQMMPSMEDVLLAQSPSKGVPMEDISVPSQLEFQHEVSQRPSELDLANESPLLPENKMTSKLPDLINNEEGQDNANPFLVASHLLGDGANNTFEQEQQIGIFPEQQNVQGLALDESEVSSTKAEFGDDSTMSFMTIGSELQKTVTESGSSLSAMEKLLLADQDLLGTEFTSGVAKSDNGSTIDDNELSEFNESEVLFNKSVTEEAVLHEEGSTLLENTVPLCFELQQELVPEMESNPERVQLESEGTPSFDDFGSPLQAEHKKLEELEESAIISQAPVSPVTSPIPDLHPPVPEERAVTPQTPEPSVQDLVVADMPSSPVEPFVPDVEAETDLPATQLQSPSSTQAPHSPLWGSTSPICVANSTSSTPETVPLGKETQSPSPEVKPLVCEKPSLVDMSLEAEVRELEERLQAANIEERVVSHDPLEMPELRDLENDLYSRLGAISPSFNPHENMSDCDISDPRHPLNQGVCSVTPPPKTELHSSLSEDQQHDMPVIIEKVDERKFFEDIQQQEEEEEKKERQFYVDIERQEEERQFYEDIERQEEERQFYEDIEQQEKMIIEFNERQNVLSGSIATTHVSKEALQLSSSEVPLSPAESTQVPLAPAESTQVPPAPAESTQVPPEPAESTQIPPAPAESTQVLEQADDTESMEGLVVAATAAATVATAVAAGSVLAHEEKPAVETKAPEKKTEAKKLTPSKDKKGPTADKAKTKSPTSTKTPTGTTGAARTLQKSTPTSPTKPSSTSLRSSTPKKPLTSTSNTAGKSTKPAAAPATANKPKPGATSPMKPLSSASKPASASQRPRPGTTTSTTTTAKSTALSNGDVAKPAVAKKTATSTTVKQLTRPATAPATTKTGTMKQVGTIASRTLTTSAAPPRPKPGAMNGVASKTRPVGTVATATARNKVGSTRDTKLATDKQVKETANKQISSARTITSKTTTVTAARNTTTTATRRVSGVPKSTVTTTTVKSSTVKVGPKKTSTTTSATRASSTASTKLAKTEVTVTSIPTENNETVQAQVD